MSVRFRSAVTIAVLACFMLAACQQTPSGPTPLPETPGTLPVPGPRTVSGIVIGHSASGVQPMAGVPVWRWVETPSRGYQAAAVSTDAEGRFSFEAGPEAVVRLFADVPGFWQPCLSTVSPNETNAEIRLIAEADLARAEELPGALTGPMLTGTVFEMTPSGRQPVANAFVELDGVGGMGLRLAVTQSDASGRYQLCGLEGNPSHLVGAWKHGYKVNYVNAPRTGGGVLDLELRR